VSPVAGRYLTGARLQLFSYLLAAQHALREERDLVVAGVFLAPLYPDARMLDYQYVQAAEPDVQRMYLYRPRGLFVGEAAERLDAQLGQTPSPVAAMKRRKDGGFDRAASRDVVMPEEIGQRLALARQTVLLAVEGIVGGKVAAAPLVENRRLACERCDFRPVCRFDRALNPVRAAEVSLPQLPERPAGEDAP
jgi:ATP-dependent helicase/DNAse subunit B